MKLYECWTLTRKFFEVYSSSIKLHIAFCITLYYILSVVSNLFLMVAIELKGRFMLQPSKCVLKITTHKPLESFQKYFRVHVNHLWYAAGLKCGIKSVRLTPGFPIKWFCSPCAINSL